MNSNNSKITKVIYNILKKKLPTKSETYKDILTSIQIKTPGDEISASVLNKLENLYTNPANVEQILFLFVGALDQYENITPALLNDFSQFIITQRPLANYSDLKKLKKAFGNDFNTKLSITAADDTYLYSKIYFITRHISKINTVTEVENIICTFINQGIKTNTQIKKRDKTLQVNKTLIYSDCYVDELIIKNIQSNIILTLKKQNHNFTEIVNLFERYYVPNLIIKKIKAALYSNKFMYENVPELVNNKVITELIKLGVRFRPINIVKFNNSKFNVTNTSINSYMPAYFEKDTIYVNFNSDASIKSDKLLGKLTNSDTLYFYNYNNIQSIYKDTDVLELCFPFKKKTAVKWSYNNITELLDNDTTPELKLEKMLMTDITNTCILSQQQHSLIELFNNIELSYDIPFVKFNDLQGGDEVCKLFSPILKYSGNLKPLIRKNTLKNWCRFNFTELNINNLDQLRTNKKGRKKKNDPGKKSIQNKISQTVNKKVILFFKIKLLDILSRKFYSGKIYNFLDNKQSVNIIHSKGIQLDINTIFNSDLEEISISETNINDLVMFKKKRALYGDVLLYSIEHEGRTLMNIQINTLNLKKYNLFDNSADFIEKINSFVKKNIIGDKFYTGKFVVSYNDLNTPIVDIKPYYTMSKYKIYYHFIVRSETNFSIIKSRIQLIDILNEISPFITLDETSSKFQLGDSLIYLEGDSIQECSINLYDDATDTYTIKLSDESIREGVEYKYLKNPDTDAIIINFRHNGYTSGEQNKIVIEYNNKYTSLNMTDNPQDTRKKINCIIMGCSDSLALEYIKKIIKLCFVKLDESIPEEDDEEEPTIEEIMIVKKTTGGGDDDVLDDDSDDEDDDDDSLSSNDEESSEESSSEEEMLSNGGDDDESDTESENSEEEGQDDLDEEETIQTVRIRNKKIKEKSEGAFLNRLYQYDEDIFDPSFPDGESNITHDRYDKVCQSSRIPKVLTQEEKDEVDRIDTKLEHKLNSENPGKNIKINSYGFGPFDRDCEYQSTKAGFSEKNIFLDSKRLDSDYVENYGNDEEYGEIIKLKTIIKTEKKGPKIKWSFKIPPTTRIVKKKKTVIKAIVETDIPYTRLKQLFDEDEYIRAQNPMVSFKHTKKNIDDEEIDEKKYTLRKICGARITTRLDNKSDYVEESYKNLLSGDQKAKVQAMKCKSIKYGTDKDDSLNWYMCPRLYDKQTNRPVHWRMLKYSKVDGNTFEPFDWGDEANWRKAKHNLELDIMDFNPEYPKDNPEPNRLWVYPKSGGVGGGGAYFYPGFLSHTKHPLSVSRNEQNKEPIFPPCCYQKYSNRFSELLKPIWPRNVNKCGDPLNTNGNKYFTIGENIQGNLGKKLNSLFGQEECNVNSGFIRQGVAQGPNSYFNLIFDILDVSPKTYPTSIKKTNFIKDTIVKTVTNNKQSIDNKIFFNDINGGFLEILFRKRDTISSFQNFIEYTLSDDVKRDDLFYEISTSPEFITECMSKSHETNSISNLILIVFEISKRKNQTSYSIKVNCPYFSKKISENLNNLSMDTHVALAIKYNNVTSSGLDYIFEPIYYKTSGKTIKETGIKKTFKISEIYKSEYNEKTSYLKKIKHIIEKFKEKCYIPNDHITIDKTNMYDIITFKKLQDFIKFNVEKLKATDIYPIRYKSDKNNKVIGFIFQHAKKMYTVPIYPESITQNTLNEVAKYINKNYHGDEQIFNSTMNPNKPKSDTEKQLLQQGAQSEGDQKTAATLPKITEYEVFYNNILDVSAKSKKTGTINIKPIKYFGLFTESDSSKINLNVAGFATSFISDVDSYENINVDQTLLYTLCNNSIKSLDEDQIIFNYDKMDSSIFNNEIKVISSEPLKPVEIAKDKENTVYSFLKASSDFGIATLYRDNSSGASGTKIVLIKTNKGVFIPIMPLDESSKTWAALNFIGNKENLYNFPVDVKEYNPIMNESINIIEPLLDYCKKVQDLSKTTDFKLPIFIKNFKISNRKTVKKPSTTSSPPPPSLPSISPATNIIISDIYLESGVITEWGTDGDYVKVERLKISLGIPPTLKVLNKKGDIYTINEIKKCNLNFYTQRYINHNNLDISLDYQGEIQISKFRYDSIIYEALVKKVNQFFSRQLHKSVKHIKLFIQRVINSSSNKFMHEDIKKRLLYPIIYAVLSIIIKPEIPESKIVKYPNININNLSNIESKLLVNLEDFTKDDIDKYIITSYKLINNIDDSSSIESIPDILREHREYNDITGALDFTKVTELYYSLKEKYNGTKYLKIKIIDHIDSGITRSEVLKHKLCNNLIYNVFIQKQIFGVYKPNISSNSRFKYNIGFEILFTKSEQDNYEKLNSLYSLTKQKYYRDIKYPVTKNVKKGKVYKFKEKGMSKVRPFLYRFQTK